MTLHNSFVCLQELEDEFELLRETKICIDKQEYDAYLFVELNLTHTYQTLFPESKKTKPEFMELLNEFGLIPPDEDSQPLITFIKRIEDIFTGVGKEGLKEKIWQITKRFLALRHEIGDEEIQRYQNQYDRKRQSEEVQDRNSSSETVRDAVLFSVRRKVALKTIRYYVTAHQWDGSFHPPVELKRELKKNELEKSITAYLSELAQNNQISTKAVIEFFLPNELINLSVDQWKIEEDEGTPQMLGGPG